MGKVGDKGREGAPWGEIKKTNYLYDKEKKEKRKHRDKSQQTTVRTRTENEGGRLNYLGG